MTLARLGGRRWGTLRGDSTVRSVRLQLVVYPPGCSPGERAWLRAWLLSPYVGGGIAVAVLVGLSAQLVTTAAAIAAATVLSGVWVLLDARTRRHRSDLRVLHVEFVDGVSTFQELRLCRAVLMMGSTLAAAEDAFERGHLDAVDFHLIWCAIHLRVDHLTTTEPSGLGGSWVART